VKGKTARLTSNKEGGSHTLPPLKEFRPRNSKPKFSDSENVCAQTMVYTIGFQKVSFYRHCFF